MITKTFGQSEEAVITGTLHRMTRLAVCLMTILGSPVLAQNEAEVPRDEWQFAGAIYLWGADIGGQTNRGSEIAVGFSDLLDNLELGFMGAFVAHKNDWSLLTDFIYLDLSGNKSADITIPIGGNLLPISTSVDLDLEGLIVHLAGGYNLYTEGRSRVDLVAGVRYLDLSTDMFLELQSLGPGQSRTISGSHTAWNGILGLQGTAALSERWFLPYYVDVGAGESELTWQAAAGFGFKAGNSWDIALIYRHLEWDLDSTRVVDDINFSGPTLGVVFRW